MTTSHDQIARLSCDRGQSRQHQAGGRSYSANGSGRSTDMTVIIIYCLDHDVTVTVTVRANNETPQATLPAPHDPCAFLITHCKSVFPSLNTFLATSSG